MTTALEIKNLTKKYADQLVFENLNFKIKTGEIVALIGKNGAGKSTLINIVNRIIKPTSGETIFFENPKIDRNRIGLMMQDSYNFRRVTVKEAINLFRSYYHDPLTYDELIKLADLEKFENKYMDNLSGGQRRRLQFALTLSGNPDIIFLDEPTTGMDPDSRVKFWKAIDQLKDQGKTFVITSHYLEELEQIANRFLFLHNHHVIFDGNLDDIHHYFSATQVSFASNLAPEVFEKLPAVSKVREMNHNYQLLTNDMKAFLPEFAKLSQDIDNLEIRNQNLDTVMDEVISQEESR
ncbi:MAG: ABC transporter ATP-binding protein [Lactobacillus sp.]|nr:ABC transporter ATP-binding protein [Lactobacillus sp.]